MTKDKKEQTKEQKFDKQKINDFEDINVDDLENLKTEELNLVTFEEQINLLKNKNLLLLANMENQRKQLEQEKLDFIKYANINFLSELIPSIELFESIINSKNVSKEVQNWLKGFEMILNNINMLFAQNGVKKIDIKIGDEFNSHFHQVIDEVNRDDFEDNQIVEIKKNGYLLYDRLITPVLVIINNKNLKKEKN